VAVLGAFDAVVAHLASDDTRVGAQASGWEQLEEDLAAGLVVGGVEGLRGKNPGGWPWSGGPPEASG
jgi:hypothetical protein